MLNQFVYIFKFVGLTTSLTVLSRSAIIYKKDAIPTTFESI